MGGRGALEECGTGALAAGLVQAAGEGESDHDAAQQGQGGGDIVGPQTDAANARDPVRHGPW
jgi:hypothetical protein